MAIVKEQQSVTPMSVVLESTSNPDYIELSVSKHYQLSKRQFVSGLRVEENDNISKDQLLFHLKGFLGVGSIQLKSPVDGKIFVLSADDQKIILEHRSPPRQIFSFYQGIVVGVGENFVEIEGKGHYLQGVYGVGGEVYGIMKNLKLYNSTLLCEDVTVEFCGYILVGVKTVEKGVLTRLREIGAKGIIVAYLSPENLSELGVDVSANVSIDLNGFAVILTERFSESSFQKRVIDFFEAFDGCQVSVSAFTQIRAGSTRPEIYVWGPDKACCSKPAFRVVADPYWNEIFEEMELLSNETVFPSGIKASSCILKKNGQKKTIPGVNIEKITIFS
ncbi:MAG: hypothetical protein NZT61_00235 [Deltaproteobacteria bacterium]|nr:hypothetical protein [Deltaproteobacteria bacterium]MCX7952865.1 hypothetical protein [Deltaproteobacteria bacterium]